MVTQPFHKPIVFHQARRGNADKINQALRFKYKTNLCRLGSYNHFWIFFNNDFICNRHELPMEFGAILKDLRILAKVVLDCGDRGSIF